MGFMSLETRYGDWYDVETRQGNWLIPIDVVGAADLYQRLSGTEMRRALEPYVPVNADDIQDVSVVEGWAARYSAAGYMDATDWNGVYPAEVEAVQETQALYGDSDD